MYILISQSYHEIYMLQYYHFINFQLNFIANYSHYKSRNKTITYYYSSIDKMEIPQKPRNLFGFRMKSVTV